MCTNISSNTDPTFQMNEMFTGANTVKSLRHVKPKRSIGNLGPLRAHF